MRSKHRNRGRGPATTSKRRKGGGRNNYNKPQPQQRGRSLTRSTGAIRNRSRSNSRSNSRTTRSRSMRATSISSNSINRLHGGNKKKGRRQLQKKENSYDGSLNSFSMRKSKSTSSKRRGGRTQSSVLGIQHRNSKSGPGGRHSTSKMSASERRKQYNMQQRYPTSRKGVARGAGAGAIKLLRRGRSTSREPAPRKTRRNRAW